MVPKAWRVDSMPHLSNYISSDNPSRQRSLCQSTKQSASDVIRSQGRRSRSYTRWGGKYRKTGVDTPNGAPAYRAKLWQYDGVYLVIDGPHCGRLGGLVHVLEEHPIRDSLRLRVDESIRGQHTLSESCMEPHYSHDKHQTEVTFGYQ